MKMTKAYRTALAQLADAIAQQDPADVDLGANGLGCDLDEVLEARRPDFVAALERAQDRAWEERDRQRKQRAIERRRATLAKRRQRPAPATDPEARHGRA